MLDLDVVPAVSIGCSQWEFVLGMHFSQAIAIIQAQVGVIKKADVLYCEEAPLACNIIVNLHQDGIRLIFDPTSQLLKIIEIFNMKLIKLRYNGKYFSSPETLPSLHQIEIAFGATLPGLYDKEKKLYALNFKGITFYFPVDNYHYLIQQHKEGLKQLTFNNGSTPVVSRMALYDGNTLAESKTPSLPLSCYHQLIYLDSALVLRHANKSTRGLKLNLFTEGSGLPLEPRRQTFVREIFFGDSCQDVATALGAPNAIFFKCEDKMRIHSTNINRDLEMKRSDIFFNYHTLGIDVLFDARTQQCKKFVLNTNYPGHFNFNMYHRCEFKINLKPDGDEMVIANPTSITPYTKWDDIKGIIGHSGNPVVMHIASSTNTSNPFGSTLCYGYQDMVFEVMNETYIASLTLFDTKINYQKQHFDHPRWNVDHQGRELQDVELSSATTLIH